MKMIKKMKREEHIKNEYYEKIMEKMKKVKVEKLKKNIKIKFQTANFVDFYKFKFSIRQNGLKIL